VVRAILTLAVLVASGAAGSAAPDRAAKARQELAALEAKLHGEWAGTGPCDGGLTFRADGTYERTHQGPAGTNSAGTWKVRWDALPPTLVLKCETSDDAADEGKVSEVKLVQLDDESLSVSDPDAHKTPKLTQFARPKK
jgi:hypothetical protein